MMTKTLHNIPIVVPEPVRRKAGLRRGDRIEFKVSGRAITIVPKAEEDDYPLDTVKQIVDNVKRNPLSPRALAAANAQIMTYGTRQAKKLGIKERDIPRLIHESRARRRMP